MVGVGRTVTGAVPSLSYPVLQVPRCCYSIRDGGMVTGVSGWGPRSHPLWEWQSDAARPLSRGGVTGL